VPDPIEVTPGLSIDRDEITEVFVRASGPGGQHVNTTSTAVELRFDVRASPNLPDPVKARLAALAGRRLSREGILVITADTHRSQQRNRTEALQKLVDLLRRAAHRPRVRRPTRPTLASKTRRLAGKSIRSGLKTMRRKTGPDEGS
jgi:ribosome-associated protein